MILDAIGIVLLIIFFVRGYMKGFIVAAFAVISVMLGIILALRLSEKLATYLLDRHIVTTAWAMPVSYIAIFLGVVLLVRLLAKAIETSFNLVMIGWLNKLAGGILYSFMVAMAWSSLLWIAGKMQLIGAATISSSITYPHFIKLAPWVLQHIGALLPVAKDVFTDLDTFFNKVNSYVGTHR
ncbi:hypothetical protein CAP35_15095 [Chitinophagaceae bacterium IBVUCB1]|nr:hypothetical protein CAP35_15095 [Chitinophagaceae bacterium IBVUCB1]